MDCEGRRLSDEMLDRVPEIARILMVEELPGLSEGLDGSRPAKRRGVGVTMRIRFRRRRSGSRHDETIHHRDRRSLRAGRRGLRAAPGGPSTRFSWNLYESACPPLRLTARPFAGCGSGGDPANRQDSHLHRRSAELSRSTPRCDRQGRFPVHRGEALAGLLRDRDRCCKGRGGGRRVEDGSMRSATPPGPGPSGSALSPG